MSVTSSEINSNLKARVKNTRKKKKFVTSNLNLMYTNADCLTNKKLEFETYLNQHNIDIALICETQPKNSANNHEPNSYIIQGYDSIEDQTGRGVMIVYKDSLEVKLHTEINKIYSPALFINVSNLKINLNLAVMYRSPNIKKEDNTRLNAQLFQAHKELKNLIVFGDYNHPDIDWENMHCKKNDHHPAQIFLQSILDNKISQAVQETTHHKPNCKPSLIDLVLTKNKDSLNKIKILPPLGKSHHTVILTSINNSQEIRTQDQTSIKKYLINKGDFNEINKQLSDVDWDQIFENSQDDIDEAWKNVSNEIKKAMDNHIPTTTIKQTNKKKPTVLNNSLLHLIREKRWLYRQYRKYPNKTNYHLYCTSRSNVNYHLRKERRLKETSIANNLKGNPKQFYQYVSSKLSKKDPIPELTDDNGTKTTSDEEKSTLLNNYFSSVFTNENTSNIPNFEKIIDESNTISNAEVTIEEMTSLLKNLKPDKSPGTDEIHPRLLKESAHSLAKPLKMLFDLSMKIAKIPAEWKVAEVRPIYKKKGKKSEPSNYRPVSLTSIVCKVAEKIVKKKLCSHIISQNILSPHQFGFVPGRSTNSQLLTTLNDWQKSLDSGTAMDIAYMDFRKAFDSVPHQRLIFKLKNYGISGKLLSWIQDFLSNRTQYVKINNSKSCSLPVTSGVPQGSVLGPMLFIYFINDLPEVCTVKTKIFADDTKAYTSIKTEADHRKLQETIDNMYQWTEDWQLKFNDTKCKILHLGENNPQRPYYIGPMDARVELEKTVLEKDLGVHIDPNLSFDSHIDKIIKKASSKSAQIFENFSYRSKKVLVPLFKTLVRPVLEYANSTWNSSQRNNIDEIEAVQRRFTKRILEVKKLPYEERLKKTNLPSLEYRRFRGDLIETYKIAHNKYDKASVNTLFNFRTNSRLRGHNFTIIKNSSNKKLYHNFFTNRVCNTWNSLPVDIVNAKNINIFKNKIDQKYKDLMFKINLPMNLTLFS